MTALKRYALCLTLLSSLHTQQLFALDSVDADIGEFILPAWDYTTSSFDEFFETLGLAFDGHTLAFLVSYFLSQD